MVCQHAKLLLLPLYMYISVKILEFLDHDHVVEDHSIWAVIDRPTVFSKRREERKELPYLSVRQSEERIAHGLGFTVWNSEPK